MKNWLFALLFFSSTALADDHLFLVANGASWHAKMPGYEFNGFNPGAGLEWTQSLASRGLFRASLGHYVNSIWRESNYLTAGLAIMRAWPYNLQTAVGVDFGVVDGYWVSPMWVAYPVIAVDGLITGFNLLVIPPVFSPWTVGFQFKWRLY